LGFEKKLKSHLKATEFWWPSFFSKVDEADASSAQAERRARDERSSANPPFANRASKGSEGGKEDEALFDYARVK